MNFFNSGLFYGGLAAISAPIIIHFLNRQRYKRIRWAAMEFLLLAFKRTRRRVQVEHLIILLIRCLMLLMLGAALARPLGALVTGGRDVYVLVDDSYSMAYESPTGESAWNRAKARFAYIVENLSPGDRLHVVFLSDAQKNLLITERNNTSEKKTDLVPPRYAIERLEDIEKNRILTDDINNPQKTRVSDFPTDIYAGLEEMRKLMFDSGSEKTNPIKEFYVLSDFQYYAWLPSTVAIGDDPIRRHHLNQDESDMKSLLNEIGRDRDDGTSVKIFLMDVGDEPAIEQHNDIVIEAISADRKELVVNAMPTFNVKLRNLSKTPQDCKVTVNVFRAENNAQGRPVMSNTVAAVDLPAGDSAEVAVPIEVAVPMGVAFGDNSQGAYWAEVVLEGAIVADRLASNSTGYYAFRVQQGVKVLIIDGDYNDTRASDSETYSLRYMLHPNITDDAGNENYLRTYMAPPVVTTKLPLAGESGDYQYDGYNLVILANVNLSGYNAEDLAALENYVNAGGHLMVFMGDKVADLASLAVYNSLDIMPLRLEEALGKTWDDDVEVHGIESDENTPAHAIFRKIVASRRLQEGTKGAPAFSKYFAAEPQANTEVIAYLNAYDNRDEKNVKQVPFMAIRSCGELGRGKSIMFNTTCDTAWGNLTKTDVDEVFIVMLHETILYLLAMEQWNFTVGDVISRNYQLRANYPIKGSTYVLPPQSESQVALDAEQLDNNTPDQDRWIKCMFAETYAKGRCEFRVGTGGDVFGVNVALDESDLKYADPESLIVKYEGLKNARILSWDFSAPKGDGGIIELEGITTSPDSWKVPLLIMVCLMALESVLALWFGRKSAK